MEYAKRWYIITPPPPPYRKGYLPQLIYSVFTSQEDIFLPLKCLSFFRMGKYGKELENAKLISETISPLLEQSKTKMTNFAAKVKFLLQLKIF